MVQKKKGNMAKRLFLALLAFGVALAVSGCPPTYEVETGDWVFYFSPFPLGVTYGLTLHPDGTATPYESTPNQGVLPGTWTWQTNGVNIWFYQDYNGNQFTCAGTLLSESAAYGDIYEGDSRIPVGQWQAALDD